MVSKKRCRVCGKEYEPCHSANLQTGVFRWREVACSPECGAVYLRQINESRGVLPKETKRPRAKKSEEKSVEAKTIADPETKTNILEPNRA